MDTEREIKIVTIEVIEHSFDYNRLIDYLTKIYKKKFKIRSKQKLNLSGIGSKRPTTQGIRAVGTRYMNKSEWGNLITLDIREAFISGAEWALSQAACASGGEGKGVCVDTECKHCGRKNDSCYLPHLCPSR